MQVLRRFVDDLWNIRWVKGHRTQLARLGLYLAAAGLGYEAVATSDKLMALGIDLPDLPNEALAWVAGATTYFSTMVAKFAQEHTPPA